MNKRIGKRWINKLLSGEYKQARGALCKPGKDGNRFCCLGVLTDMYIKSKAGRAAKAEWVEKGEYDSGLRFKGKSGITIYDGALLPQEVMEWAGIQHSNGCFGDKGTDPYYLDKTLTDKNDRGCSFKQIAGIIEKNMDKL